MTVESNTNIPEPLDPIGYDDALLIRAALAAHAAGIRAELEELPPIAGRTRDAALHDVTRLRWLANRSWYGAQLDPRREANDRGFAMAQLEVIAAGVDR